MHTTIACHTIPKCHQHILLAILIISFENCPGYLTIFNFHPVQNYQNPR
jgi:hypothetical protein